MTILPDPLTDLVDGRIARLMGQASPFGKTLDSTVDFVLIYGLFIALYAAGRLAAWQFAMLYLAMIPIVSLQLSMSAAGRGDELASTTLEKVTGALQCTVTRVSFICGRVRWRPHLEARRCALPPAT